jgi:hypothetical protein
MHRVASAVQAAGLTSAVIAGALVSPALGFAVAAVELLAVGVSLERRQ